MDDLNAIQLPAVNYLALRLVRLQRSETWPHQGGGFTFILLKGGGGKHISGSTAQNLLPGGGRK
jgi:hypothetical protein